MYTHDPPFPKSTDEGNQNRESSVKVAALLESSSNRGLTKKKLHVRLWGFLDPSSRRSDS